MRKALLGTLLCLAILIVAFFVAVRWPALFWLTVLAGLLYLAFGRRAEVEFRAGLGRCRRERQLYIAVAWKRPMPTTDGGETAAGDSPVSSEPMRPGVSEVIR